MYVIMAPFTFLHERERTAMPAFSFVCHTLLTPGQVTLKGYSFHSLLQMESHAVGPPLGARHRVVFKRFTLGAFDKCVFREVAVCRLICLSPLCPVQRELAHFYAVLTKSAVSFVSLSIHKPSWHWKWSHSNSLPISFCVFAKSLNLSFNTLEMLRI